MTLEVMQEGMVGWLEIILILRVEGRFRIWWGENTAWGKGDSVWSSSRKVFCILEDFFSVGKNFKASVMREKMLSLQ